MTSSSRALAVLGMLGTAACSRPASPEQLRATLAAHPEILYEVIRAHPAEFVEVMQQAVQAAQPQLQARSASAERARIDSEFVHPKTPAIEHRAILGNPAAPVTIVEYTDFECPYCLRERDVLTQVLQRYGDRVKLVVKQTPLDIHPHAMPAALWYEAIARQDPAAAFRFYDVLYTNQDTLKRRGEGWLPEAARAAGADVARAAADVRDPAIRARVQADIDEFQRFGFTGTPGLLINGVSLQGAAPAATLEQIIERHLGEMKQQ